MFSAPMRRVPCGNLRQRRLERKDGERTRGAPSCCRAGSWWPSAGVTVRNSPARSPLPVPHLAVSPQCPCTLGGRTRQPTPAVSLKPRARVSRSGAGHRRTPSLVTPQEPATQRAFSGPDITRYQREKIRAPSIRLPNRDGTNHAFSMARDVRRPSPERLAHLRRSSTGYAGGGTRKRRSSRY